MAATRPRDDGTRRYGLDESRQAWNADDYDWIRPASSSSVGSAFGVMAFCFGVAPLALQLEASMAQPKRFAGAQRVALSLAFVAYLRRADSSPTDRGRAAAATWIFRG